MKRSLFFIFIFSFLVFSSENINPIPTKGQVSITPEISQTDQISIPLLLNYQGKLTDPVGNPVRDSSYSITFRLYNVPSGGTAFWSETKTVQTRAGLFHTLLGSANPITSLPLDGNCYLEMQVNPNPAMSPRIRIVSSAYSYIAKIADTAHYAQNASIQRPITPPISTNEISDNAITSIKIQDGTIVGVDLNQMGASTGQVLKWTGTNWAPANDSAGGLPSGPAGGDLTGEYPNPTIANGAVTSEKILDGTIQMADITDDAITSSKIQNGTILGEDINQMGATTGQVLKWTGTAWMPQDDISDNAWTRVGSDSVIYTIRPLGIARGGVGNMLYGAYNYSHVNFGSACTTGSTYFSVYYSTVSGGYGNAASGAGATIGGGLYNKAGYMSSICGGNNNSAGNYGVVGGGVNNQASGDYATVSGGYGDTASGSYATVGGGRSNTASGMYATIAGGYINKAINENATIGGGMYNTASGMYATIAGGYGNNATNEYTTVGGGCYNTANGYAATVAGGYADTSAGDYSFTTNNRSIVPSYYSNSAAFNGQTATASNQLRCGTLSKAGGSFTIDHPLDPYNKILNHYFVEGPEMLNIYRGSVILDANGKAEVKLPDYFSALNRNPHIQLTGVGTSDVYVLEDVKNNRFVIGGKPGTKVYWIVTGERADISAEVIRRLMPVEQEKTGELKSKMLDDEFLSGCMEQLEREGKAIGINFRTAEGRKRYEDMKRAPKELEKRIEK